MSNAKRDDNRVATLIGLSTNGSDLINPYVDPSTHRLYVDATTNVYAPATSGGLTIYRNIDLDETGILISTGAHQLYGWYLFNNATSVRYVKFYNKATAPTVGTDTPLLTIPLVPGGGANVEYNVGIDGFALGIGVGATTGVADNNTGAPSANDVIVNIFYY